MLKYTFVCGCALKDFICLQFVYAFVYALKLVVLRSVMWYLNWTFKYMVDFYIFYFLVRKQQCFIIFVHQVFDIILLKLDLKLNKDLLFLKMS